MQGPADRQPFSRRRFLSLVGAAGGSAAVYQTGLALGLIPGQGQAQPRTQLASVQGVRVVILGAGISGLVAAYELEQAGYDVTVIEAARRIGGRNLTVRAGDLIDEMGNPQVCRFDDHPDLYLNCGPARIAAHHRLLLHYCRLFGVALEPFINVNYQAYVHDSKAFGGKPVRYREYVADARGFMAELAAKSISQAELEKPLSAEDLERFLMFLRAYGDLDEKQLYKGSGRRGYMQGGLTEPGVVGEPFDFSQILQSDFWRGRMHWGELQDQAAPMLQARGGNDHIVRGFVEHIRSPILTDCPVQSIRLLEDGVQISYERKGRVREIQADYCLNCIPSHLLPGIRNNFPSDYLEALGKVERAPLAKIGLQMKERFWERDNIYGGITWTDHEIEQIWYPSHGLHQTRGVLLGAYLLNGDNAKKLTRMDQQARLELAIRAGEQIHPEYRRQFETGVTVCWQRMNYMMGCHAVWTDEAREAYFRTLQQPVGRHYLMGDQISYHPGWQEGAISSAHYAMADLQQRVQAHA